jgi:SAM-dependent methyltransferase
MYFYRRRRFWIPALDGVQQKLTAGTRVADIGCGYGASTLIMAKAFPKSEFYSLPGFQTQVLTYLNSGRQASGNDLYIIWIGANDFSDGIEPAQTVANIENGIAELSAKGARTFVVINVPDISLTPLVKSLAGQRDRIVDQAYKAVGIKPLRSRRGQRMVADEGAFEAGFAAGDRVSIASGALSGRKNE